MLCDIDGATITAMLTWPPRRFMISQIDVAITLLLAENQSFIWENSSRISLSVSLFFSLFALFFVVVIFACGKLNINVHN